MARYYMENNNPKGKHVGDCTVRAIAKATGQSWDRVYTGICAEGFEEKDMPDANAVWGKYLKRQGFKRKVLPDTCPDCYTVKDFCVGHPQGTYVLALQSHVVATIDGCCFDTWDSTAEPILFYWECENDKEGN